MLAETSSQSILLILLGGITMISKSRNIRRRISNLMRRASNINDFEAQIANGVL